MVSEIVTHVGEVVVHPPIQFYAGDTWQIDAYAENADGTAMDLTGAYVEWRLADSWATTTWLILTAGNGISVDPDTSGRAIISLTPAQTGVLPAGFYRDQFTVRTPSGVVSTQFQGRVQVLPRLEGLTIGGADLAGTGHMVSP